MMRKGNEALRDVSPTCGGMTGDLSSHKFPPAPSLFFGKPCAVSSDPSTVGHMSAWRDKAKWQAEIPSETLSLSGTIEVHTLSRAKIGSPCSQNRAYP
jgi:hypothetical protein